MEPGEHQHAYCMIFSRNNKLHTKMTIFCALLTLHQGWQTGTPRSITKSNSQVQLQLCILFALSIIPWAILSRRQSPAVTWHTVSFVKGMALCWKVILEMPKSLALLDYEVFACFVSPVILSLFGFKASFLGLKAFLCNFYRVAPNWVALNSKKYCKHCTAYLLREGSRGRGLFRRGQAWACVYLFNLSPPTLFILLHRYLTAPSKQSGGTWLRISTLAHRG